MGFCTFLGYKQERYIFTGKRFDLSILVKEVEEEFNTTNNSHHLIFHPIESVKISTDRNKISQVIQNLIGNAIKYSPQGSTITVSSIL